MQRYPQDKDNYISVSTEQMVITCVLSLRSDRIMIFFLLPSSEPYEVYTFKHSPREMI